MNYEQTNENRPDESSNMVTDTELLALAALAQVESVLMAGDNAERAAREEMPAWREGCGFMPAGAKLREELAKRGVL